MWRKLVDYYVTCTKQELIEKLVLKNARLLAAEKEIDRLNEYVQIMELQSTQKEEKKYDKKTKKKSSN
tara:strand:+ start:385 stop:588 length:204 start_codon:yes stop_codon:yes gene_type:complete